MNEILNINAKVTLYRFSKTSACLNLDNNHWEHVQAN